jgi:hypothetical protein
LFRIRFFSPPVVNADGWRHAGGELVLGDTRLCFLADLSEWTTSHYERQWRDAIGRLARGETSTALMTSYRGPDARSHVMWALWRDEVRVYIQEHAVLAAELDAPFDPAAPYAHVGEHIAAAENGLPISEWHVPVHHLEAALLGFRRG